MSKCFFVKNMKRFKTYETRSPTITCDSVHTLSSRFKNQYLNENLNNTLDKLNGTCPTMNLRQRSLQYTAITSLYFSISYSFKHS